MKKINTQFYTVFVRTFVIPFYYGSGSGSHFLACHGSGSASQKVTVPTVPVPQRCFYDPKKKNYKCKILQF